MSVKRYKMLEVEHDDGFRTYHDMVEASDGGWVKWEDYVDIYEDLKKIPPIVERIGWGEPTCDEEEEENEEFYKICRKHGVPY